MINENYTPDADFLEELREDWERRKLIREKGYIGMFQARTANDCLMQARLQPVPRNLYHSLVYEGEITFLFADTGVGKSILAVQIANEISATDKVLYIDLELSDKQFESRYSEEYENHYTFNDNLYRIDFRRHFSLPDNVNYDDYFIDSLLMLIKELDAKIIIIDNMTKLIMSDTDSAKAAKPLMDRLCEIKFEHRLTLLLLEHTRKTDMNRPLSLNDLQGSKMKSNFADAAFCIGRSRTDKNIRYIKQLKCRSAEISYSSDNVAVYEIVKEGSFLRFHFMEYDHENNHLWESDSKRIDETDEKIIELKKQNLSNREIARQLGLSEGSIRKRLGKLDKDF